MPEPSSIADIGLSPLDNEGILVSTANYNASSLFYSNDGGESYRSVLGSLAGESIEYTPAIISVLISSYKGKLRYWAGTSAGLYYTDFLDGDNTKWQLVAPEYFGLAKIMDIKSRVSDGLIAVATYGRGVVIGQDKEFLGVSETQAKGGELQIYPNPTQDGRFYVDVADVAGDRLDLSIYTLDGRLIKRQELSKQEYIDISGCMKGTYILEISSVESRWSGQLIL